MPVIIIKARENVITTKQMKAELIDQIAETFARVIDRPHYKQRVTVIIEEYPWDNWGKDGKQYEE
jgi:4-oxalocrotonate tautomerase family enzyme